ncbi:hypothetical protein AMJ44_11070 [candidate division WOR-1 bacterium DG_54_3]|uniref:Uncharacterized protein n=1 Tax=candidate division WOR-1 bacterium DG_54_3 TaxID=1703775 RepID=A0A0S7XRE9_UNCSA|nr:MAG: hypothetical protein AMJ44_11070 [candidate division WOR-1 bacterium DG_54_3]
MVSKAEFSNIKKALKLPNLKWDDSKGNKKNKIECKELTIGGKPVDEETCAQIEAAQKSILFKAPKRPSKITVTANRKRINDNFINDLLRKSFPNARKINLIITNLERRVDRDYMIAAYVVKCSLKVDGRVKYVGDGKAFATLNTKLSNLEVFRRVVKDLLKNLSEE